MSHIRAFLKFIIFIFAITCYFITAAPFFILSAVFPFFSKKILVTLLSQYSKFALWFMNIKINIYDYHNIDFSDNHLIVSNHLSYLDVLVISSIFPACFVTSVEIKKTPFLGQLCMFGGCLFVERRSRKNLSSEIKEMTDGLKYGLNVMFFPEGTSTNGEDILRFKKPLFKSSVDSKKEIIPLSLKYIKLNGGESVNKGNRDKVCWYGDMTFLDHLWNLFRLKSVEVSLTIGSKILPQEGLDYSDLASSSYQSIRHNFINKASHHNTEGFQ